MGLSDSLKSLKKDKTIYTIVIVMVILVVIAVIYKIVNAVQTAGALAGEQLGKLIVQQQTGVQVARQTICQQIATTCKGAVDWVPFVSSTWGWAHLDQMIPALNQVTSDDEMQLVSLYFMQDTGVTLKSVVDAWNCTGGSKDQITYYSSIK